jgi:hypothetical protein
MSLKLPNIFGSRSQQPTATPQHLYEYKTRFSMLGTVASGKTTISGFTVLTAETLSCDQQNFQCEVIENTSDVLAAASNLRRGRFPSKTTAYSTYAYESGLSFTWKGMLGDKRVHVPICDIAGEDIQQMIIRYGHNVGDIGPAAYSAAQNLITYVKESDGFVLVVPASKALMFKDDRQIDAESQDIDFDPDVNLARILGEVIEHKRHSRGKQIKGIAVVITKWDLAQPFASNLGMDIFEPSGRGLTEFMHVCFPATSMRLKASGVQNVRYFPSYVDVERDENGNKKRWPDGSDKIVVKDRRKPSYSEQTYVDLINYLRMFAS